jgi:hypothetical protein
MRAIARANVRTLQIDPSGQFAYVSASVGVGQHGIYAYAMDANTGGLTLVPGSPFAVSTPGTTNFPLIVAITN